MCADDCPPTMLSMVSTCGDFLTHRHCLERWFGVSQFIVVEPVAGEFSSKVFRRSSLSI
jgi:hypothetical protein